MHHLSQTDFLRLAEFMKSHYGLNLMQKKHLIESRLNNTLYQQGFNDFSSYIDHLLSSSNQGDLNLLLNRLTTNHTYFMREAEHFTFLRQEVLPWIKSSCRSNRPSFWSAGCSSGEEPYTMSMILLDYFSGAQTPWDTQVLATDISEEALDRGRQGIYQRDMLKDLPSYWVQQYFDQRGNDFRANSTLRDNVDFRKFNLMENISFKTKFDVIFCRNVMIYFEAPVKEALVRRFYNSMNRGGYLFIGLSETLPHENQRFQYIKPSIYRKL